jgi:hypothetical protein
MRSAERTQLIQAPKEASGSSEQIAPEEDVRYWTGETWARSLSEAKVYASMKAARDEGEPIKIWDNVPAEWQNDERKTIF